jgi:hypothetical protein
MSRACDSHCAGLGRLVDGQGGPCTVFGFHTFDPGTFEPAVLGLDTFRVRAVERVFPLRLMDDGCVMGRQGLRLCGNDCTSGCSCQDKGRKWHSNIFRGSLTLCECACAARCAAVWVCLDATQKWVGAGTVQANVCVGRHASARVCWLSFERGSVLFATQVSADVGDHVSVYEC